MNLFRKFSVIPQLIFLILALVFSVQAAGELDPSFNASAYSVSNGNVNVVKIQPDGKILIGGFFHEVNGFAASGIARLNPDGTTDTSFKSVDFYGGFGIGYQIFALAVQADGKILVGGGFYGTEGVFNPGLRRLNADGSLDTSFNIVQITVGDTVYDIEIQSDNKILVGGNFRTADNAAQYLVRLNTDGTYDNSFQYFFTVVRDIELQADGKIVIGGGPESISNGFLYRLTTTGAVDDTFTHVGTSSGRVYAVKIRPDGKILIGGDYATANGFIQNGLSLANSDGSLDLTFNQNNPGPNAVVNDIAVRPDGKILIGGGFSTYNTTARAKIAQLNSDGTLDTSFQNNPTLISSLVKAIELLPDGRLLVGMTGTNISSLLRFNTDGTFDSTFTPFATLGGVVNRILQLPDGKILAAGQFRYTNGLKRNCLARFNSNGSVDTTFVPYFNETLPSLILYALAVQPDGKVLVGSSAGFVIKRLNTDGTEDLSFTTSMFGTVADIAVLSNGQILVGGDMSAGGTKYIVRLNANGTVDTSFALIQPNALVRKILVQPDGKILIGGEFTQIGVTMRGRIARLNTDGSLDNTFNPPGGANEAVYDLDLQTDGKVVLGGTFSALNGSSNQIRVGRLNADGTLDAGFVQSANADVVAVKILPDGKILIGGAMSAVQGAPHNGIARLNSNGTLDPAFNTFANTTVRNINLQSDGKILLAGAFTKINRLSAVRIARLLNASTPIRPLFDYDGDGKADVSVFRPSENKWYILRSSDFGVTQQVFAIAGDIPVPADYDGDGKTDFAIFRPSSGDWWSLSSLNGAQVYAHWGASGDIPRPSDFDGDGRTDYVVFRPSNNFWYRISSATGISSNLVFGLAGDKPVRGDFDGDGKSDVAIFRPSTGDWWYQSSINGAQLAVHWGISTDIPAPADFDGDGKTDFAVYRPSTGVWYIINSSNFSFTIMHFGIAEDKPTPGDYDGDGKADIAVFRPSTGAWYLQQTTAGFWALSFGISTDIPTENAFVQ